MLSFTRILFFVIIFSYHVLYSHNNTFGSKPTIHSAAYLGQINYLKFILQDHCDVNALDENGFTPLMWSVYNNKTEAAVYLIKQRQASVFHRSPQGHTAMLLAAQNSNFELLVLLALRGASINDIDFQGNTVMHYIASGGRVDIMEFLLDFGGDPDVQNNQGRYPMEYASMSGHSAMLECLVEYGAYIPQTQSSVVYKIPDTTTHTLDVMSHTAMLNLDI